MSNKSRAFPLWLFIPVLVFALLACSFSGSATPSASGGQTSAPTTNSPAGDTPVTGSLTETQAPIVHTLTPGEPPASQLSNITDRDSSVFAAQKRANGGENFGLNLFERPFNQAMDQYFPQLDISKASLTSDGKWTYINIQLIGQGSDGKMTGMYGVEFDLNVDGRGDVLVMANNPGASWSTDGVGAWTDPNHDVGGQHPVASDAPITGDGYETQVFNSGVGKDPDIAWARISPTDPKSVQIAIKPALINDDGSYAWGVWTMNASMFNPAWFDYNDHFTLADAGSPLVELTQYYPPKAFYEADNTCRWAVGFKPIGNEPGICPVPATPTPIRPGTVSGTVYDNGINGGLAKIASSIPRSGIPVSIRSGSCSGSGASVGNTTTNATGYYSFSVPAGSYCVEATLSYTHTGPQSVTVANGGAVSGVNFFYYQYLGMQ
jgi:hypothetical protein